MRHQTKQMGASHEERPPVFGSWPGFYAAVVVWLALLIVFFYLFTQYFSR